VIFTHVNPDSMIQVSLDPVSTIDSKVSVPKVISVANSSPMKSDMRVVLWGLVGIFERPRRVAALRALYPLTDSFFCQCEDI
jgi:hypothetical protein